MLTPNDVIQIYTIVSPILLAIAFILYIRIEKPNVIVNFPKILLCGKTDSLGTTIDIQGNGMLSVHGITLPGNKYVLILEISNG